MKIKFYFKRLILLFVVLFAQEIKAQEYTPFPTDSAFWFVRFYEFGDYPEIKNLRFVLKGDTVINDKKYSKLYSINSQADNFYFLGGLREEEKKVYYIGEFDGSVSCISSSEIKENEILLYDFSLNIGDTVPGCHTWQVVVGYDSVLVSGRYHKRQKVGGAGVDNDGNIIYEEADDIEHNIEGVGTGRGIFYPLQFWFEWDWELLCFEDSVIDFKNACNTVAIENRYLSEQIQIAPNPITELSYLQINSSLHLKRLSIYDLYGRKIRDISINNMNRIPIYRNYFPLSGLYFIRLESTDKVQLTKKIFVN